ncbi:VOC family protein [Streptococcus suis]|uniref:Glyoxalase/bleomycin resistance protein/dioxygenase superfamily protein n=1 Tax=Streptococcus suis TaxID=1307 RepID=A0A0Z8EY83_STRSU|nr:VOC family protein [Streptococcus suis]MCK4004120.1 VOC family protein [Streptococcus suis]NQH23388.1 VOC family protein [Streptococcus suis]NQM31550.1 VOC family protein [Streptococcus suis]NQN38283.1 VOC family protein [Streptococcus suis]NQP21673.1 VOC family protein [Streptococcus suis]
MLKAMEVYLVTNGNGLEAIEFYKNALGATVEQVNLFKDFLPDCPAELENYVMNAQFRLNDQRFMLSDNNPEMPYTVGDNITVALITDDAETAQELYSKLSVDATAINMELQAVPWSPAYGNVTDKFGISWQINAEVEGYGQEYYAEN